ncbi:MAG: acyl-CoA dehydrogenase family protein [Deltaproteobacteria bacterium]|jgi:alkylation response protein AidB-like acyl-CoA dehydrogenase|nr:acyl-CoA dehydrogenase family protein [Deltaproteobacteria bacterium]
MDFSVPAKLTKNLDKFSRFIETQVKPHLALWNREREIPRVFFEALGSGGWYGLKIKNEDLA